MIVFAATLAVVAPALAGATLDVTCVLVAGWMLLRWDTGYTELAQDIADMIMPMRDR